MARLRIDVDQIFDALGDPTRRTIIRRLGGGPASVSHLAAPLAITLAAVVQHLQVLEECGIVKTRKVGRVRTCSLVPEALTAVEQWVSARRTEWENHFDRLGAFLADSPND